MNKVLTIAPNWRLVPIIEPMDIRRCNVYEHTPLDYYRYGEYPRFIRPVGAHHNPTRDRKLERVPARDGGIL